MIEVLVAATILIVIVMMLGMLFQQTSLAWRTGTRRADSFMQVRSAVGAIQRDASAAVDAKSLPSDYVTEDQHFSPFPLLFYTLTGTVEVDKGGTTTYNRSLKKIKYEQDGTRTETTLQGNGNWGTPKRSNVRTFAERQSSKNRPNVTLEDLSAFDEEGKTTGNPKQLPLFLTFSAKVQSSGYNLDIGAASAGPDRKWGTKDDIKTWVED